MLINKNDSNFTIKFKEELSKQMDKYLTKYLFLESDVLKTSTVLDPKYKKLNFLDDKKEIKKYYSTAIDSIKSLDFETEEKEVEVNSSLDFSDPKDDQNCFANIKQELEQYVSFPKGSVKEFYKKNCNIFSKISKAAKYYLITPATSVRSERVFKHAQFQV